MRENCPVDVNPYDQSGLIKPQNPVSLNYTNQDFWSMKTRLVNFIKERFGPNGTVIPNAFNDFVESSLAIMLIENFAFVGDMLSFKQDQYVNEFFIDTVTEVSNAFRLAKLVGFQPTPPIAASSMWSATINSVLSTDVVLDTPLVISATSGSTPITIELFQADENNEPIYNQQIVISAGSLTNTSIVGLEGQTYTETFVGNGLSLQTLTLTQLPVIFDSIQVSVDGVIWSRVDAFTDSSPRQEYRVEFDSTWQAFIVFGNNKAGLLPGVGAQIEVIYRVGGGVAGNIVTGSVTVQKQADVTGVSFKTPISLSNYTKGSGGYAGDTVEDIRRKLPQWVSTQDRCVSGSDYKILTEQFATPYHGQIGKAQVTLRNQGCAGNIVDIYVLAKADVDNLETASNSLKVDLIEELNTKKMITDFICVKDGVVIETDVSIEVILDKFYKKFQEEIKSNILAQATIFFSLNNWDYEKTLRSVDLVKALSGIQQVDTYVITFTTDNASGENIYAKYYEIIRPYTIDINFIYN